MDPSIFQKLCARTECNQKTASDRRYIFDKSIAAPMLATRLYHACLGMSSEVGEVAALIEKWLHFGQDLNRTALKEELGDVLWYVALACNAVGLDMGNVMDAVISKLQKRYPDKYTDHQAAEANRDRDLERMAVEATATAHQEAGSPIQVAGSSETLTAEGGARDTHPLIQDGHGWGHSPDADT